MTRQTFDVMPVRAMSSDRIEATINLVFHYQYTDPVKLLELDDFGRMMEDVTKSAITTYANLRTAEDIKASGVVGVAKFMNDTMRDAMAGVGVQIIDTLIQSITVSADHDQEMTKIQRKARLADMETKHAESIAESSLKRKRLELAAQREEEEAIIEMAKRAAVLKQEAQLAEQEVKLKMVANAIDAENENLKKQAAARLEASKMDTEAQTSARLVEVVALAKMQQDGTYDGYVETYRARVMAEAMSKMNPQLLAADVNQMMGYAVMGRVMGASPVTTAADSR
jgi:hypothetical protein